MSVCLPPETRTLLRFHGPDADRYLNGQLTQDVRDCSAEKALPACVTDAKGKLQFYVTLFRNGTGDLVVDAPLESRQELLARLTKYLIADDVEVEDVSEEWQLVHFPYGDPSGGVMTLASARISPVGWDAWLPAGFHLPSATEVLSSEAAEDLRIRNRFPAWGAELTTGMLAPEAGLDRTAISYRKGCYIGQEVLSRMKTAGKLNRRLVALAVPAGTKPGDSAGQGIITSVSSISDGETAIYPALGYLHKSQFDSSEVEITGSDGSVRGTARVLS